MFARNVSLRLKPNTLSEFTRICDKEVIPRLRKQSGFRDEIIFAVPGGWMWSQSVSGILRSTRKPTTLQATLKCSRCWIKYWTAIPRCECRM
jgi:hypothetical protein